MGAVAFPHQRIALGESASSFLQSATPLRPPATKTPQRPPLSQRGATQSVTPNRQEGYFHGKRTCFARGFTSVNVTVGRRSREYLTEREVERLIEAAKQNRSGHRVSSAVALRIIFDQHPRAFKSLPKKDRGELWPRARTKAETLC
jgi:hypothetical protein